jgi:hypothetical protein
LALLAAVYADPRNAVERSIGTRATEDVYIAIERSTPRIAYWRVSRAVEDDLERVTGKSSRKAR